MAEVDSAKVCTRQETTEARALRSMLDAVSCVDANGSRATPGRHHPEAGERGSTPRHTGSAVGMCVREGTPYVLFGVFDPAARDP